jgi:hypothetical protein
VVSVAGESRLPTGGDTGSGGYALGGQTPSLAQAVVLKPSTNLYILSRGAPVWPLGVEVL